MLVELEEGGRVSRGRPHRKIAVNSDFVISIRAISNTECQMVLTNQEPVTVDCPYQDLLDMFSGSGNQPKPSLRVAR